MKLISNIFIISILIANTMFSQIAWIRINQLGYQKKAIKVAVFLSLEKVSITEFKVIEVETEKIIYTNSSIEEYGEYGNFSSSFRLNFSNVTQKGWYYIKTGDIKSPEFRISDDVYNGTADFILNYMRQQRCGYNPFLKDSCHTHDGFIVDHPNMNYEHIDVLGGWHDASDYLQYLTTSANATYQLLFAYSKNPQSFKDEHLANGDLGSNGIPDILDEAKWGLDWLVKMNPENGMMFNQIADDRDHAGYRLPTMDSVNYGKGLERPVYYITGKQQGLAKFKNRTTGVSSSAAKFASAFALGSKIMKNYYPEFSQNIMSKAIEVYDFAKTDLGVCQTASNVSPYFYEEDNYVDDLELAAVQLYLTTGKGDYLNESVEWGKVEPITPWMGADTARHYQWYPFVNLGHYYLAQTKENKTSELFQSYINKGLERIYDRGKNNPFLFGVPFIWCSNNLVAAALTQIKLFEELTGSVKYSEMEAALRDWLFGCNPWGTSMIVGLPEDGDFPAQPHSSLTVLKNYQTTGGLVDGPVYGSIFKSLLGLKLVEPDEYKKYQSDLVVYHDDSGDYSTNEPTMDGTASLSYYLSELESKNRIMEQGAIIRGDISRKTIFLMFSGGDFNDGNDTILSVLSKHNIKANFFFTGDYFRNKENDGFIRALVKREHYVGPHSDKHLLYMPWENRNELLVTKAKFITDLENNYVELKKYGIDKNSAEYFLPPYEWYNSIIADWTKQLGLELLSFSPGTRSNADYTTPSMGEKYVDSKSIYNSIIDFEKESKNGLNGFHLLLHVGTHPDREDKFYHYLDELIEELARLGYSFEKLDFED